MCRMKRIGIIGGGIMAKGMANNFLKAGYEVSVWNRTQNRVDDIIDAGGKWAETPRDAAAGADILIECVSDDEASRAVWTDAQDGILAGAHEGGVYIASSSLSLSWVEELGESCEKHNVKFLDMPLTGSRAGAEGGTLRLLVGGDEKVLAGIREELGAIAEKIYHFGPSGSGMRFKLILNTLIGIHTNAAAQAYALAQKAGLDVGTVQHALFDGGMGPASPATKALFANADMPDSQVNFALQWLEKDLRYAQAMAGEYGVEFDLLDATQADFARAKGAGLGEMDIVKVVQMYRGE
jgi:3-hydroxyisobutyrate dehydrogenase